MKNYQIRGASSEQLNRTLAEIEADLAAYAVDEFGAARSLTDSETDEFDALMRLRARVQASLLAHDKIRNGFNRGRGTERALTGTHHTAAAPESPYPERVAQAHDEALRTVERYNGTGHLNSDACDAMDGLIRQGDPTGVGSRYLMAVGDPAYNSAFGKVLADPVTGHLRFSPEEVEAFRTAVQVTEERAMAEATGAAGQYALPLTIDPTILLSSNGALNPVRTVARQLTINTFIYKGVSSNDVVGGYAAEGTEASDGSPTLSQPAVQTQRGQVFVPFSIELDQDWQTLQDELALLIADYRNQVDATKFLTGSGTNEPFGVLTGLTTTQRVQTNTTATYAVGDPWLFRAGIAPRFLGNVTFAAAPAVWDTTYRFVGTNSVEPLQMPARDGNFLGRPKIEWSTMATTTTTTGTKIMIAGDFSQYLICDRMGMQVELVPHLFGATNRYPTGQRGVYAMWRTGANVMVPNAFRYLEVK